MFNSWSIDIKKKKLCDTSRLLEELYT